jgi:hypothetical protein
LEREEAMAAGQCHIHIGSSVEVTGWKLERVATSVRVEQGRNRIFWGIYGLRFWIEIC